MTHNTTKAFRSLTALLLALILLLSMLPAAAETPDQIPVLQEGVQEGAVTGRGGSLRPTGSEYNNTNAFKTYVKDSMYFNRDSVARSSASSLLASRLSKDEKALYDALLKKIKNVAAGKSSSTHFKVSFSPKFTRKSVHNSLSEMDDKIKAMISNVVHALLGDGPSEMYWFDKTEGWAWNYTTKYDRTYCWITNFYIDFYVAKEFSATNTIGTVKTDTSKGTAVQNAVANAKQIMQQNRGKSDTEKLRAYKNAICKLNDYNTAAASDSSTPYGNPWQLVWVFDGDPSTNVVCEGYSKAFQYLCELSAFSGNVSVLCMNGYLFSGNYYLGRHMWNVVTMSDKKRYMVDVTNCDTGASGTAGSDDLFLVGYDYAEDTSYGKKYVYGFTGYVFDQAVPKLFTNKDRTLNGSDYNPSSDQIKASGICGADAEWSLRKNVLKIEGSGKMYDYSTGSPAPWKQYAGSIKKIVIGNSITQIGNYAFDGLRAVKSVTLGEAVKKIGKFAFNGCKKVSTFTITGTKLKTIGGKAFKGFPKKVTFVCPAKKLSAYKKLLLKKGAPKTATFK